MLQDFQAWVMQVSWTVIPRSLHHQLCCLEFLRIAIQEYLHYPRLRTTTVEINSLLINRHVLLFDDISHVFSICRILQQPNGISLSGSPTITPELPASKLLYRQGLTLTYTPHKNYFGIQFGKGRKENSQNATCMHLPEWDACRKHPA